MIPLSCPDTGVVVGRLLKAVAAQQGNRSVHLHHIAWTDFAAIRLVRRVPGAVTTDHDPFFHVALPRQSIRPALTGTFAPEPRGPGRLKSQVWKRSSSARLT